VAAATCSGCGAWTSTASGYCTVCRRPLGDSPRVAAIAPPPPSSGAAAYVGLPGPFPAPAYPIPAYAAPGYPPAGYAPTPYGVAPAYAPPPGYAPPPVYAYPAAYVPLVPVPYAVAFGRESSGARFGAAVLDAVIAFGVWSVLFLFVYPALFPFPSGFAIRIPITLAWLLGYYAVQDGFAGGTIGKKATGLTLVNKDLKPIRPSQGFLRSLELFLWFIAGGIILLLVQHSMVQNGGQGVGDKLAGCYLVPRSRVAQVAPRSG